MTDPNPTALTTGLGKLSTRELVRYAALTPEVRAEALRWHELFLEVESSGRPQEHALADVAVAMNRPFATARRLFFQKWRAGGRKWHACINRAKAGGQHNKGVKHSPVFEDWWVRQAGGNQRGTRAARSALLLRWRKGDTIPGLDNSLPRTVPPPGCSYSNLCAILRKHEQAILAQRRGLAHARSRGPLVLTTRQGLWCGSHIVIDDMWHDNFVLFQGQLVRVLQLSALDMFSGQLTTWGCKPRFQRADGTFDNLKERFARLLVLSHLSQHGYSPRGTEFLAEHGTAAISGPLEDGLARWTDGAVTVSRSGITGRQQALLGLGLGDGGGNFRFKTWLESWHNLLHNELAALPGQTGLSVERRPEFTVGQLKGDDALVRAAQWLFKRSPREAALLQSRLLHYHAHFLPLTASVIAAINARGQEPEIWDHDLEGWTELGHVANEFRFKLDSGEWLGEAELMRMDAPLRETFLAHARQQRGLLRTRKLSPNEVWTPGRRDLTRLPDVAVAELLGDDFGRELRVDRMSFAFQDAELSPEGLQYESRLHTPDGMEEELPSGETYWLTFNPFNLANAFVHDARRRFLGTVRRDERVCRLEVEAVQERFQRVAARSADVLAGVRRAHTADLREETRRLSENTDLLAAHLRDEGIKTPGELRAEARRVQQAPADSRDELLARASEGLPAGDDW